MIRINLLPWRESKLKKMRKALLVQCVAAIVFPSLVIALCYHTEIAKLEIKKQSLENYRRLNQPVLDKLDTLSRAGNRSDTHRARQRHLRQLISQKNRSPQSLALLTSERRQGRVNQLTVDLASISLSYEVTDQDDTLALFQLLNAHPMICDVSLDPAGTVPANDVIASYEFNAKLCDYQAN